MKTHLLSIFPVNGGEVYARLSCIALTEVAFPCADPFTCSSRAAFRDCLVTCFTEDEAEDAINRIEAGETVHRELTDANARALGFQSKIQ